MGVQVTLRWSLLVLFGKPYREIKYDPFFVDNAHEFMQKASKNVDIYAIDEIDKNVYNATEKYIYKTYDDTPKLSSYSNIYNPNKYSDQRVRKRS